MFTFQEHIRVLGRGVEYKLLSGVGQRALQAGKRFVELRCVPTARNQPAKKFIASLGDQYCSKTAESWLFPAEYLTNLHYRPDDATPRSNDDSVPTAEEKSSRSQSFGLGVSARSEQLRRIGEDLFDVNRIVKAIDAFRLRTKDLENVVEPDLSQGLEGQLLSIWRKILGRPGIGPNETFFEVGGTSLKAVQVIAMIRRELKQNLSITSLFECPTVRLLAGKLSASTNGDARETSTLNAAQRGHQRRFRALRRTRSQ